MAQAYKIEISTEVSSKEKIYNHLRFITGKDIQQKKTKKMKSTEVFAFNTNEEIKAMIDVLNGKIDTATTPTNIKIAHRNKLLFLIGINIGVRGSDICRVKWNYFFDDDMTFKENLAIKPYKTRHKDKYARLTFNDTVKKAIQEYIELYPIKNLDDYVFESREGGYISRTVIGRIIKNASKEAGIKKNICSHSLRKTFGYHVWHNADDKQSALVILQYIFNHSNVRDTMKYIGILQEDADKVFNGINLGYEFLD